MRGRCGRVYGKCLVSMIINTVCTTKIVVIKITGGVVAYVAFEVFVLYAGGDCTL